MPEIADVISSEQATSEWANLIKNRTIQRYADAAERASEHSSPAAGDLSYLASTGDLDVYHSGAWRHLNGPPVGTIIDHAGGSVPIGYLVCDGSAVSRTTYAGLFAQIGTIWGSGDGSTTFNLPDFRGRVARGVAASGTGDAVGETFGADTHTHTGPSHVHSVNPANTLSGGPTGLTLAQAWSTGTPVSVGSSGHGHNTDIAQFNSGSGGTGNTGSSSTIQAGAAVNKLIRT